MTRPKFSQSDCRRPLRSLFNNITCPANRPPSAERYNTYTSCKLSLYAGGVCNNIVFINATFFFLRANKIREWRLHITQHTWLYTFYVLTIKYTIHQRLRTSHTIVSKDTLYDKCQVVLILCGIYMTILFIITRVSHSHTCIIHWYIHNIIRCRSLKHRKSI